MLLHRPRFSIMALFAKRLPITLVPKQNLISPVRSDMINNGCRSQFSGPFTLYTKRMLCQKPLTRLLPLAAITTFNSIRSIAHMKFGMLFAVLIVRQSRTTGMLTRGIRTFRHRSPPWGHTKSHRGVLLDGSLYSILVTLSYQIEPHDKQ